MTPPTTLEARCDAWLPMRRLTADRDPTHPALRGRLAGIALVLTALAACGPGGGQNADREEAASARTYQVRGVLRSLPDPATGGGQLQIRHEAIPDLVGTGGEVEGMAAMTMAFPVADEVDLTGFGAGDPVRFDLRVDWDAARPVAVTAIEKLPVGTELTLD